MCGEKKLVDSKTIAALGSPPHVRGKVFACGRCPVLEGITPACAGKSSCQTQNIAVFGDHPRMCGEKTKKIP